MTEQIEKALDRKVWLPSGGSLVIDRTEAMTVVDVNTGKFVGSGGNLEETVTKNNLEAAEEIVRQLRLRDIGGIIVVDFIDMVLESNRDLVLRRLVECLSRDRTKHQVAEVTSLGLVQMTRKKLGLGLLETFSEACEVCAGRGVIVHHDPVVKHRAPIGNGQPPGRRPRAAAANTNGSAGGTHVITEGVKSALAQIAASTIHSHHDEEVAPVAASVEEVVGGAPEEAAQEAPGSGIQVSSDREGPSSRLGPERPSRAQGSGSGTLTAPRDDRSAHRHAGLARAVRGLRRGSAAAALARRDPQTRGDERAHERVPVHMARTGGDQSRVRLIGHVVVVAVEATTGDAVRLGERVQLVEVGIADQVRPQPAVRRPARIVDQDRHEPILRTGCRDTAPALLLVTRHPVK